MTALRPRPTLATVICVYEVGIALFAVLGYVATAAMRRLQSQLVVPHMPLIHIVTEGLTYTLAITGAVALWKMRHVAFYLLAARPVLSAILLINDLALHAKIVAAAPALGSNSATLIRTVSLVTSIGFLCLNVLIAGYARVITDPKSASDIPA